jgi:hypothetical protein
LLRLGAKTLPVALARITRDESDPRDKIHLTNEGTQVFVAPASRRRFCDFFKKFGRRAAAATAHHFQLQRGLISRGKCGKVKRLSFRSSDA